MADRPIIFSGSMVRALIAGRKTQTRRILKPEPASSKPREGSTLAIEGQGFVRKVAGHYRSPYAVGDRLYVREAWAPLDALTHNDPGVQALADRGFYKADESTVDGEITRWRPSIHMPRWASRMTLVVTEVRVERLQDISWDDAMAEGIVQTWGDFGGSPPAWALRDGEDESHFYDNRTSVENFRLLWESINGPEAWAANPWVVAISFTVHQRNIDQLAPADALDIAGAA